MLLIDRTTLLIVGSAFIAVVLCLAPATHDMLPFSIINAGAHIADVMFHEIGHTVFSWLAGIPAIPMIFTIFGANEAGGMAMTFGHSWLVHAVMWAVLAYGIYFFYSHESRWFIVMALLLGTSLINAVTGYGDVLATYMGHGGAILAGSYFLFRAWIYLDARNQFERWLNGFFGFYLILCNMFFSYRLIYDEVERTKYSGHAAFGAVHNDFMVMTQAVYSFSIEGIAWFTIFYGALAVIGAFIVALCLGDEFPELEDDLNY